MNPPRAACLALAATLSLVAGPARAQTAADPEAYAGVEVRTLRFDRLAGVQRLSQTVVPFGVVIPLGRFTLDLGSMWVHSRMVTGRGSCGIGSGG